MTEQSERPTCATCPYWSMLAGTSTAGGCRSRSPRIVNAMMQDSLEIDELRNADDGVIELSATAWPVTRGDDWCGDHPDFSDGIAATRQR